MIGKVKLVPVPENRIRENMQVIYKDRIHNIYGVGRKDHATAGTVLIKLDFLNNATPKISELKRIVVEYNERVGYIETKTVTRQLLVDDSQWQKVMNRELVRRDVLVNFETKKRKVENSDILEYYAEITFETPIIEDVRSEKKTFRADCPICGLAFEHKLLQKGHELSFICEVDNSPGTGCGNIITIKIQ